MAQGALVQPKSCALYNGKPILPDYCMVDMVWMNAEYEQEELDIPTKRLHNDPCCSRHMGAIE